jgi:hypothetical protein
VSDAIFAVPRLAEIYDLIEGERDDLEHYLAMAAEFAARGVLDVRLRHRHLAGMRGAPDRPGREWVFLARKPDPAS